MKTIAIDLGMRDTLTKQYHQMTRTTAFIREYQKHSFQMIFRRHRCYLLVMGLVLIYYYYMSLFIYEHLLKVTVSMVVPALLIGVFYVSMMAPLPKRKTGRIVALYYAAWFSLLLMGYSFLLINWYTSSFPQFSSALLLIYIAAAMSMRGPVRVLAVMYGTTTGLFLITAVLVSTPFGQAAKLTVHLVAMVVLVLLYHQTESLRKEAFRIEKELSRKLKELEALSRIDGLTRMNNRQYFDENLYPLLTAHVHRKKPLALFLVGIDAYDAYKKNYGKMAGEHCLVAVAARIQEDFDNQCTMITRYGEDQFALVCELGVEEAFGFAEKLRVAIEDLGVEHKGSPKGLLTASVGMAVGFPHQNTDVRQLVTHAEEALQWSREQGGDKYCLVS